MKAVGIVWAVISLLLSDIAIVFMVITHYAHPLWILAIALANCLDIYSRFAVRGD